MRGRGTTSVVASPVLVGAVTILVVTVSVFLAYNANRGLPFVPTYDLSVRLPSASNLVRGDEVRAGGFRVGVVDSITPGTQVTRGRVRPIAVANLKLDFEPEFATKATMPSWPRHSPSKCSRRHRGRSPQGSSCHGRGGARSASRWR